MAIERKALISDNVVVNVILIDTDIDYTPPNGETMIDAADAGPGEQWDGSKFIKDQTNQGPYPAHLDE